MLSLTIYDQARVASENVRGFRPIRPGWDIGGTLANGVRHANLVRIGGDSSGSPFVLNAS